jgi:hypothetical protein
LTRKQNYRRQQEKYFWCFQIASKQEEKKEKYFCCFIIFKKNSMQLERHAKQGTGNNYQTFIKFRGKEILPQAWTLESGFEMKA